MALYNSLVSEARARLGMQSPAAATATQGDDGIFAWLGDTPLSRLCYAGELSEGIGVEYAEHALILGKPTLQATGVRLIEQQWSASLLTAVCDVDAELSKLKTMVTERKALDLVYANGVNAGKFVVNDLSVNYVQTVGGKILAADVSFALKEFVELDALASRKRAALDNALANAKKLPLKTQTVPLPNMPKVTGIVESAQNKLTSAIKNEVNRLKNEAYRKLDQALRI